MSTKKSFNKGITRRNLLKASGLGVAAVVMTEVTGGLLAAQGQIANQRLAMVIDLRRCVGCMSCQVSCKMENDVPLGVFRAWVKIEQRGQYPNVSQSFLPMRCNHCTNPPCVSVCPTRASYIRGDGIVMVNYDKCIGCRYCIAACPYGARFLSPVRRRIGKCTFCIHRVEEGLEPTCVRNCMGRAIIFGDLNDPSSKISKVLHENRTTVLKEGLGTEPNVYYIDMNGD